MLRPSRPMMRPFISSRGQADRGDRDLGGDLGGDALDRRDEDVPRRFFSRRELGFLLDLVDDDLGVVLGLVLEALDDELLGFFGATGRRCARAPAGSALPGRRGTLPSRIAALIRSWRACFLLLEGLYLLVEVLFLLDEPALVALKLGPSFPYFPFLLVSFPNELIFRLYQDFFLLSFGLFDRVLLNPLRLLLGGGELKSGIKPADHPSQEKPSKRKGYIQYSHRVLLLSCIVWSIIVNGGPLSRKHANSSGRRPPCRR